MRIGSSRTSSAFISDVSLEPIGGRVMSLAMLVCEAQELKPGIDGKIECDGVVACVEMDVEVEPFRQNSGPVLVKRGRNIVHTGTVPPRHYGDLSIVLVRTS